jgi:hypothetical protein
MWNSLFHLASLIVTAVAIIPLDDREARDIQWGPCPKEGPGTAIYALAQVKIECGMLTVPLDWTSSESKAKHNISLVKVPAQQQPAKGSIQFNFGGPGFDAKSGLLPSAEVYQA